MRIKRRKTTLTTCWGNQSLTVVLSRTDFPFPSSGHMVIPKILPVTVAMTVSRSLPLEGSDEGHDWTPTVHAKVPHNKEFTYPSIINTRTQEPWSTFFVGFPPFYKIKVFSTPSWYLISYKNGKNHRATHVSNSRSYQATKGAEQQEVIPVVILTSQALMSQTTQSALTGADNSDASVVSSMLL